MLAGCGGHGGEDRTKIKRALRPRFTPVTSTSAPGAAGPTTSPTASVVGPPSTSVPPRSTTQTVVSVSGGVAAITDRAGDVTTSVERPPAWVDLVGATLSRTSAGFELRVRLGGGEAPTSTDEDHTMNVASFYDVDGDGSIDYEIWANLAARGWGSSYFDDVHHGGGFQERSGVHVTPEGDEVVLRFPASHLGSAAAFRWSVSSEWGRYQTLGTVASARDDAPDDDAAAPFPGP